MTVESAVYLNTLNPSLPPGTDPKAEGDDHIRLVKAVLKATFPNVTGPVTITQDQINAAATKVDRAGDTMTGLLKMAGVGGWSNAIQFQADATYQPIIQTSPSHTMNFSNGDNSANNLAIDNAGNITARGAIISGTYIQSGSDVGVRGRVYMRANAAGGTSGGVGGELAIMSGDGTYMFIRGRNGGGGFEIINNAYNAIVDSMDDGGTFRVGNGAPCVLSGSDGNIYSQACGGWLTSVLGGKAPNGAQVQWNSGISESAQWAASSGAAIVDTGNPWVVEGVRTQSGPGWCWFRIIWQRNA